MKNTKILITIITLTATTLSFADIGDLVRDVAQIPGKVVQGAGEVGETITPTEKVEETKKAAACPFDAEAAQTEDN